MVKVRGEGQSFIHLLGMGVDLRDTECIPERFPVSLPNASKWTACSIAVRNPGTILLFPQDERGASEDFFTHKEKEVNTRNNNDK